MKISDIATATSKIYGIDTQIISQNEDASFSEERAKGFNGNEERFIIDGEDRWNEGQNFVSERGNQI